MSNELKSYRELPKYNENPFKEALVIHMTENSKDKIEKVITSDVTVINDVDGLTIDRKADNLLVGKIKHVDNEQFTKVYQTMVQQMTDISDKAIKILFWYIMPQLEKDALQVAFDLDECAEMVGVTKPTIYSGLAELLNVGVIAKSKFNWLFYINPVYIFNGNRIRVVEEYRKVGTKKQQAMKKLEQAYDDHKEPEEGDDSDW